MAGLHSFSSLLGEPGCSARLVRAFQWLPLVLMRLFVLVTFLFLATVGWPLSRQWAAVRNTALRSSAIWTFVAALSWLLAGGLSACEPRPGSWVWLGHFRLLAATSLLAPLVAALGARWPGSRAWNLIVLCLLVVFSLPVLEQWLLGRSLEANRVGMDGPRFAFYWAVAGVGILNYLPTRFGPATALFACSAVAQSLSAGPWTMTADSVARLNGLANLLLGSAAWLTWALGRRKCLPGLDGAWLRFRDWWGVVWASRLRDRWNAAAEYHQLPLRLQWDGFRPTQREQTPDASQWGIAEHQFRILLRRFADPDQFLAATSDPHPVVSSGRSP